jgi:hypothetical protein
MQNNPKPAIVSRMTQIKNLQKKKWKPPSKKEQEGKNPTGLSPWNWKACHSSGTALL